MKRIPLSTILIVVIFVLLVVVITIIEPTFLSLSNMKNIGRQMSINAIIAAGMTMVILTGGIDLSVGSVLAFSGVLTAMMMVNDVPIPLALLLGVGVGAALGAISGGLIAWAKLPPFVVTLAMMVIARSLTRVVTGNNSIYNLPESIGFLGGYLEFPLRRSGFLECEVFRLPVPVPIILTFIIYLWCYFLLRHYRFGRAVYAIGGNEEAARLSGIAVNRVKILVYTICGALSAFAGIVAISRLEAADPKIGFMFELDAIAAVVVGGASLMGGRGHIAGTFLGVVIVAVLRNAMTLLDIDPNWQGCVQGVVIIAAALASRRN